MNGRLKELRDALGLSTRSFSERLGMSSGAISLLENGKRSMTSQFISSVCREFKVNEDWLRSGEGDMFAPKTDDEEKAEIAARIYMEDDPMIKRMIQIALDLSPQEREMLRKLAERLLEEEGTPN